MHNGIDAVEVDQQVGVFRMEIFLSCQDISYLFLLLKTETLKAF